MTTASQSIALVGRHYNEPSFPVRDMLTSIADPRHIFVFGSNLRGIHGAGAAKTARAYLGAIPGHGKGFMGSCYAIPTKHGPYENMSLEELAWYVESFKKVTHRRDTIFHVTAIGTGRAGFTHEQIAPLFNGVVCCYLPIAWRPYIDMEN